MRFVEAHSAMQTPGAVSRLARDLGITPGAVSQWQRVPAEKVLRVSDATGIPPEKLRPDLYREANQ